jgi:hypothetical protein
MAIKLRGNTTMGMVNNGMAERNSFKPKGIGTTTTISQVGATNTPSIGQSYNKMIGGDTGIGSGGFYNSMAGLEGASMRLADAASKRSMQESEKEYGLKESQMSKLEGYSSPEEMYSEIRKKKQMEDRGYVKSGGRWIKQQ